MEHFYHWIPNQSYFIIRPFLKYFSNDKELILKNGEYIKKDLFGLEAKVFGEKITKFVTHDDFPIGEISTDDHHFTIIEKENVDNYHINDAIVLYLEFKNIGQNKVCKECKLRGIDKIHKYVSIDKFICNYFVNTHHGDEVEWNCIFVPDFLTTKIQIANYYRYLVIKIPEGILIIFGMEHSF